MRRLLTTVFCLGLLAASPAALADFYITAKTGPMIVDIDGADDPTNIGVALGYELGIVVADLAIEAELTRTASEGDVDGSDLEVETNGLYVTFTTPGALYLKLRGGVVDAETTVGNDSDSESGTSLGVGLGLSLGLVRVEFEFTQIEDDVDFLSVGVQF